MHTNLDDEQNQVIMLRFILKDKRFGIFMP